MSVASSLIAIFGLLVNRSLLSEIYALYVVTVSLFSVKIPSVNFKVCCYVVINALLMPFGNEMSC
jgi:hypothetical protein